MSVRPQHETLIADYLARGGTIRRIPPPKPTVAADVLQYLQDRNVDVRPVPGRTEAESSYLYKGQVIDLKALVAIANRHRSRRHLPPFQLTARMQ
jgi:hypothetical protein